MHLHAAAAGDFRCGVRGDVDDLDALGGCRGAPARGRRVGDEVGHHPRGFSHDVGRSHGAREPESVPLTVIDVARKIGL